MKWCAVTYVAEVCCVDVCVFVLQGGRDLSMKLGIFSQARKTIFNGVALIWQDSQFLTVDSVMRSLAKPLVDNE
jgi:hypothetical protein